MALLESKYLYFILLAFTATYPLAQSFEWRITFYKKWKRLFTGIAVMVVLFIPWDIWFTSEGVWWFNENYTTGIKLGNLPVEECLFFVVVPFAVMFIYEVLKHFIKTDYLKTSARYFLGFAAALLAVLAIVYHNQLYTVVTFTLTSIALFATIAFNPKWLGWFMLTYLVSLAPFLLVNGILTGMWIDQPVVNYNPDEIIGLRIISIPIEDSVYNLLMLLSVMWVYELKSRQ